LPAFQQGTLAFSVDWPTSLAFGPDGRLYVAALGEIDALTLQPGTQQVLAVEQIASGLDTALGVAFDPTAPLSPVTLYASHQDASATDSYEGVVSRFVGPSWTQQDIITGLPSSAPYSNHFTNGLAFDSLGRLLIAQGSNTDAGVPAVPGAWPETPLSAAVLLADIDAFGFNGAITYSPPSPPTNDGVNQVGGDVSVYAAGLRNPYDLVVHSNGYVYATDNGPGGAIASASCTTTTGTLSRSDELNLIEAGNYYGHPNRNRGRTDARQCVYHTSQEASGGGYTAPIAVLPDHCSCDGLAEYTSGVFGGAMDGDLVMAEYENDRVSRIELSADGRSVVAVSTLVGGLSQPLDVAVGPDGTIYIAEFSAGRVSYLSPLEKSSIPVGGLAGPPEAASSPTASRGRSLAQATARLALAMGGLALARHARRRRA
jgi:glucose/arabinose dehydrogenase